MMRGAMRGVSGRSGRMGRIGFGSFGAGGTTALVDVVFLLLLYFMLSSSMARESSLVAGVEVPGSAQRAADPFDLPDEPIVVTVLGSDARGVLLRGGGEWSLDGGEAGALGGEELRTALAGIVAQGEGDRRVVVRMNEGALWGDAVAALDELGRAGFAAAELDVENSGAEARP